MKKYNHKKIEKIVQKYWKKYNIFKVKYNKNKKKYYCLSMIPYPSGNLHIGHVRNYTIGDIISRYQRLKKKNVLHPIGWDSFGLPAENAAIENNLSPKKWTKKNISCMKKQLKILGISYDWNREIDTSNPKYYKWEQWLFNKLFKKKLVYKKKDIVNWCPNDKTVLANEQVINGKCWRCNSLIKYKNIKQWFIKITKYSNKLYNNLKKLNKWPKNIINIQKKWIGKIKGIELNLNIYKTKKKIKIFTKNINLLNKTLCIGISINNKIINFIKKKNPKITNKIKKKIYINNNKNINKFIGLNTNLYIKNPINNNKIQLWIINFAKQLYNTNSILIYPNKKYNNFIKKYNIKNIKNNNNINIKKIKKKLIKKKIFKKKIIFKLRDWVISRQRYWGVPIPIIYKNKKYKILKKNKLPIKLPKIKYKNFSKNLLKKNKKWKYIKIKNKIFKRETDTFDTFMESSWYHIRYTSPKYKKNIFETKKANYWLPIDTYIGGIEHAAMHLIYFRFINIFLKNIGLIKYTEPVKRLICQGIVLSDTYYYINNNKKKIWVSPNNVNKILKNNKIKFYLKNKNIKLTYYGINKMSKSKNNGINPMNIINKYGADTLRLFIIFSAPIEENLYWKENNIKGCYRFLNKLWNFIFKFNKIKIKFKYKKININKYNKIIYSLNKIIKEITYIINKKTNFNTIISKIMIFFNIIKKKKIKNKIYYNLIKKYINIIIIIIYPFSPHITFYLWKIMKNKKNIENSKWPIIKNNIKNIKYNIKIPVQINGKTKKIIKIKNKYLKNKIIKKVKKNKKIKKILLNKKIKNIIYIKNKIINFVIK